VIGGVLPFVGLMMVAIVLLCVSPGISVGLPNVLMGTK
jgi:C4-dicarboxylate transporter, DctM subunit